MDPDALGAVSSADTIAARATPEGPGAIAVIRMSGPRSRAILGEAVRGTRRDPWAHPRRLLLGLVEDGQGRALDQVLVVAYPAPRSYTGEDLAEIHTHGGAPAVGAVLERLFELGARQALPGEFSRRAFENGRMSLDQAEAVARIVEAGSREELLGACRALNGELGAQVAGLQTGIEAALAGIEARLEFPEEGDVTPCDVTELDVLLQMVRSTRGCARWLGDGGRPRVVVAGRPNVGKSSLVNVLCGVEAVIVSPQPGTTRDAVAVEVVFGGHRVTLVDTAGREPREGDAAPADLPWSGPADQIAVRRAREQVEGACLVLWVASLEQEGARGLEEALAEARAGTGWVQALGRRCLGLVNKIDRRAGDPHGAGPDLCWVSALRGDGIPALRERIGAELNAQRGPADGIPWSARQAEALRRVEAGLERARHNLAGDLAELAAQDLRGALDGIGLIRGQGLEADTLARIFERFCIGK